MNDTDKAREADAYADLRRRARQSVFHEGDLGLVEVEAWLLLRLVEEHDRLRWQVEKTARDWLDDRNRLRSALEIARDMTRHVNDPHAASSIRSDIDEALRK